jgi:hypothetical protein
VFTKKISLGISILSWSIEWKICWCTETLVIIIFKRFLSYSDIMMMMMMRQFMLFKSFRYLFFSFFFIDCRRRLWRKITHKIIFFYNKWNVFIHSSFVSCLSAWKLFNIQKKMDIIKLHTQCDCKIFLKEMNKECWTSFILK